MLTRNKTILIAGCVGLIVAIVIVVFLALKPEKSQKIIVPDGKEGAYLVDGDKIYRLRGNKAKEVEIVRSHQYPKTLLTDEWKAERDRKIGITPPQKDGFFTELWQSAAFSAKTAAKYMATILESFTGIDSPLDYMNEVIRTSQDQKPYDGYEILSLDPVDFARTFGALTFYIILIGIPIGLIMLRKTWIKRKKKNTQDKEVVDETSSN